MRCSNPEPHQRHLWIKQGSTVTVRNAIDGHVAYQLRHHDTIETCRPKRRRPLTDLSWYTLTTYRLRLRKQNNDPERLRQVEEELKRRKDWEIFRSDPTNLRQNDYKIFFEEWVGLSSYGLLNLPDAETYLRTVQSV